MCIIDLCISKVEEKTFQCFPTLKTLADDWDYAAVTDKVQHNVLSHLGTLNDEFSRYFPVYGRSETQVIKKSLEILSMSSKPKDLPDHIQEVIIELQNDSNFKNTFESGVNLTMYLQAFRSFMKLISCGWVLNSRYLRQ